jgi:hypothetical protein
MSSLIIFLAANAANQRAREEEEARLAARDAAFADICAKPDAEKFKTFLRAHRISGDWVYGDDYGTGRNDRLTRLAATGNAEVVTAALEHVKTGNFYKQWSLLARHDLEKEQKKAPEAVKALFTPVFQDLARLIHEVYFIGTVKSLDVSAAHTALNKGVSVHAGNNLAFSEAARQRRGGPMLDMLVQKLHHDYDGKEDVKPALSALQKAFDASRRRHKEKLRGEIAKFQAQGWKFK